MDGYPGLQRDVQTYLKERIREVLTGSSEAITIRIFGPELEPLREKAEQLAAPLATVPGMIDLHVQLQTEIPQIDIEVDLAAAERYGIKPGDVRRAASALMASEEVNDTYRDGKIFDVRIYGAPEVRNSRRASAASCLTRPSGAQVRLDEVADVSIASRHPTSINREGTSRRIDVGANVQGSRSRGGGRRRRGRDRHDRLAAGVPPGTAWRVRGTPGGVGSAHALRDRGGRSASSCCSRPPSAAPASRWCHSSPFRPRSWAGSWRRSSPAA